MNKHIGSIHKNKCLDRAKYMLASANGTAFTCRIACAASYSGSARMSLSHAATRGYFEKSF